ncbi:type IV pilus modification protein PilV [Stutzerimonas stutzeri]|uniref:type IV pilus modification protein PilV n=1 Tax=Stutzerimonas stutzeri TaxID=316 RepID=UPI0015E486A0|nr:type IV pilus modification protein PilV [Stutzerimonas stutzeri]MBA1261400.1 type IV pilus modification protein PilV [Stutzerimonas stutzeri]
MKKQHNNQGFSLIEVLVTLVLLTIGILALVAMQGRGIQFTSDSIARNNAIMLATEILETMRANPGSRDGYLIEQLQADGECAGASIDATDVAEQLTCWSEKARTLMPGANGDRTEAQAVRNNFYVCRSLQAGACAAGDGSTIEVQIAWRSNGEHCSTGNDPFICTLRLRGEL